MKLDMQVLRYIRMFDVQSFTDRNKIANVRVM